jgi:hypothetical protein
MASKAKSGMSAVRMFAENIAEPPNSFLTGDPSFATKIRDGKGHAALHAGVVNNTAGELQILQAWRTTGPFVKVFAKSLSLDATSGFFTADMTVPVVRRYVQVQFVPAAKPPGLGVNFEIGAYFLPRADSTPFEGSSGVVVISTKGDPGTVIDAGADTVVGIGATVPLPAIPPTTRRMTVQNTGPAGTWIRVRRVGGPAGSGKLMPRLGEYTYGGADGAVAALEAEDVSLAVGGVAVATTVLLEFEED